MRAESPPIPTSDLAAYIEAERTVRSVYQPIVELETRRIVAWEALARGPQGSPLERPDHLFAAAEAAGRLVQLDHECRAAAIRGALDAGLARTASLFVNVEPRALGQAMPEQHTALVDRAEAELDPVVEITERSLTARPAELLAAIERVRSRGWRVALDDVGADTRSLGLMPLVRPDIIKLDLRLVQEQPTGEIAAIVNAVNAESERHGSIVLAEGIETEAQLRTALAMGARLGQGWLFGRPGELDPTLPTATGILPPPRGCANPQAGTTPFDVVAPLRDVRRADKRLLLAMSQHLENEGLRQGDGAVVVSAFQEADRFTPATQRRYIRLVECAAFVAALGHGMSAEPAPGVRGAALDAADRLRGEWSVAVIGPHFAGALVAIDLGDDGPDMERRFDFCLTYDRQLVVEAAAALMRRVRPIS